MHAASSSAPRGAGPAPGKPLPSESALPPSGTATVPQDKGSARLGKLAALPGKPRLEAQSRVLAVPPRGHPARRERGAREDSGLREAGKGRKKASWHHFHPLPLQTRWRAKPEHALPAVLQLSINYPAAEVPVLCLDLLKKARRGGLSTGRKHPLWFFLRIKL